MLSHTTRIVAFSACWAAAAHGADPAGELYEIEEGTVVEACGGFIGDCRALRLTGTLRLTLDAKSGAAAITESRLRLAEGERKPYPFPAPGDLQPVDLIGRLEGDEARFTHPAGTEQEASWTLIPEGDDLLLNGRYFEGCCDRWEIAFDGVRLRRRGDGEPR